MPMRNDLIKIAAAAGAAIAVLYTLRRLRQAEQNLDAIVPTKEEQAWLDKQIAGSTTATAKTAAELATQVPTADEQTWLDAQLKVVDDEEMLDDARQAAFPPGETSPDPKLWEARKKAAKQGR